MRGLPSVRSLTLDDAAEFFSHALDINSDHTEALRDSAFTYVAAGRMDKAAERVRRAREVLPHDSRLRMLDYGIRLTLLINRVKHTIAKVDPRRALQRWR